MMARFRRTLRTFPYLASWD